MPDVVLDKLYCYHCEKTTMHTITVVERHISGIYGKLECNICHHGYGLKKPERFSPYWQERMKDE